MAALTQNVSTVHSSYGLENHGFANLDRIFWNLNTAALYEQAIRRREGTLSHLGPMVFRTGIHTGRSPNDKFVVREPSSEQNIWWAASTARSSRRISTTCTTASWPISRTKRSSSRIVLPEPIRAIGDRSASSANWPGTACLRIRCLSGHRGKKLAQHVPEFTIIQAPHFQAIQDVDGTNSGTFIILNFAKKVVLIGGTEYAGEAKKSVSPS